VPTIVVTGVAGGVGRRVAAALVEAGDHVVGIDLEDGGRIPAGVDLHQADLVTADLKPLLEGADAVVHLAFAYGPELDDDQLAVANVEATRRLLDAAGDAGVRHLVFVSSAAVYGAWPDNPVPLTEDAPVRPNPEFTYAVHKAECERLCHEWREGHPGATVAVLRPAVAIGEDESWLARSLWAAAGIRTGDKDPPSQFVHVDDLASAVVLAVREGLDGVHNVAADGWIDAETVRSLAGGPPRLPVPERLATRIAALTWRLRVSPMPPGIIPYTVHPWVVANGRLRGAGWSPGHSNEEAFVATHPGTWWSRVSPRRRQELALGASAAGVAGIVTAVVALVRRRSR
jgi:nucleoside-diphosphate-sugar epimerase